MSGTMRHQWGLFKRKIGNDRTPPAPPTNVTFVSATDSTIQISWTASVDALLSDFSGYIVWRSSVPSSGYSRIGTVLHPLVTFTDTGLTYSTSYYYRVLAFDKSNNESALSGYALGSTTVDVTPPTVPVGLLAYNPTANKIDLVWIASSDILGSGVAGYRVYRSDTQFGTYSQIGTSVITSYQDLGLSPSRTYWYKVAAYDVAGNLSGQSNAATETTDSAGAVEWNIPDVEGVDAYLSPSISSALGGSYSLLPYVNVPEGMTPSFSRTGGTAPEAVMVSGEGVTVPAGLTSGTYTLEIKLSESADDDWIARSTGPGVVFAHDFRDQPEVDAFIDSGTNIRNLRFKPRRLENVIGNSGAMRTRSWATTTTSYLPSAAEGGIKGSVGTTDLYVADASVFSEIWPPADAAWRIDILVGTGGGGEYLRIFDIDFGANKLVVGRGYDYDNNDYRQPIYAQPIGSRIGQVTNAWNRPLAAFNAQTNGKGEPDIGITQGHCRAYRYKASAGASSYSDFVPTQNQIWSKFVGGYWGHKRHMAQYPTFTSTDYGTYTDEPWMTDPRDGSGGDEFYLQFRMRFSESFFQAGNGKISYLLNMVTESVPQQVFIGGPNPLLGSMVPQAGAAPFWSRIEFEHNALAGNATWTRRLSQDGTDDTGILMYYDEQRGGASIMSDGRVLNAAYSSYSGKLAYGLIPDKWITFLMYCKPGGHNFFPQAVGFFEVQAPASVNTTPRVEQIVVRPSTTTTVSPGFRYLMAAFPDPLANKPAVGTNRAVSTGEGVGQPWGNYMVGVSYGGANEAMQVQAVADNGDGTQTLTVLRNWYRNTKDLSSPIPVGTKIQFGPYTGGAAPPRTHPAHPFNDIHIVPYQDWHFKLWVHTEGENGYSKIIDKSDYALIYGGNDWNNDFSRNPPAWNAFAFGYYPNPYLYGAGANGAPFPVHIDCTQVILSRNFIPCPTDL